jgi:hypothetical protein
LSQGVFRLQAREDLGAYIWVRLEFLADQVDKVRDQLFFGSGLAILVVDGDQLGRLTQFPIACGSFAKIAALMDQVVNHSIHLSAEGAKVAVLFVQLLRQFTFPFDGLERLRQGSQIVNPKSFRECDDDNNEHAARAHNKSAFQQQAFLMAMHSQTPLGELEECEREEQIEVGAQQSSALAKDTLPRSVAKGA